MPNPAAKAAEAEPSADELANYAKKRRKLGEPLLRQIRRSERSFGLYFGHFARETCSHREPPCCPLRDHRHNILSGEGFRLSSGLIVRRKRKKPRNCEASIATRAWLVLADDRHLLLRLVTRDICLVADHDHLGVGRALLDDLALPVGAAHDEVLGSEGRSGGANKQREGEDVLEQKRCGRSRRGVSTLLALALLELRQCC